MVNNSKAIEELILEAEQAKEPGSLVVGQAINAGDEESFGAMTTTQLESAGYSYIYDRKTGERSLCNNNMLLQHLKKKRPDGSAVFTTQKPKKTPERGTLKCMLHPDDPNRKHYDEMGLAVCRKANLTSPFQVIRHMQKRHKMEWQTIEQERVNKEKEEEREFRRVLMDREKPPLYVSDKKKG